MVSRMAGPGAPTVSEAPASLPYLEVCWVPEPPRGRRGEPALPVTGLRWPLPDAERLILGRGPEAAWVLPYDGLARRHAELEFRYGRRWLRDLGAPGGTRLNGRLIHDGVLAHGDVIELPVGLVLRYVERPRVEAHHPDFEAALVASPDDESQWQVYADWLEERDDDLARRVRGLPHSEADDARALGTLATFALEGAAEVRWAHGVVQRLVVRQPGQLPAPTSALELLSRAATERVFHFLRELELDLWSFGPTSLDETTLGFMLSQLARLPFPALEVLRVGPLAPTHRLHLPPEVFDGLRAAFPRLTTTASTLFTYAERASLELLAAPKAVTCDLPVGERRALTEPANFVGPLADCAVQLRAPDGHEASKVAVRVEQRQQRWWLDDLAAQARPFALVQPVRVNGRETVSCVLRDGDRLELAPGVLFQFHLE